MAKARSKTAEGNAQRYKSAQVWKTNRTKRLERDLKNNPGNEKQILLALERMVYRRSTPTTPFWSASRRRIAELFKRFSGKVDVAIFSSNDTISFEALHRSSNIKIPDNMKFNSKTAFNLGTRISKL